MHLGAVGLVSQVSRVWSLHPVTTNMRTMARPAITASVFMVYRGSLRSDLRSMLPESLVVLGGRWPMRHDLRVRLVTVSNRTPTKECHASIGPLAWAPCNRFVVHKS